jgi:hypothetical protein
MAREGEREEVSFDSAPGRQYRLPQTNAGQAMQRQKKDDDEGFGGTKGGYVGIIGGWVREEGALDEERLASACESTSTSRHAPAALRCKSGATRCAAAGRKPLETASRKAAHGCCLLLGMPVRGPVSACRLGERAAGTTAHRVDIAPSSTQIAATTHACTHGRASESLSRQGASPSLRPRSRAAAAVSRCMAGVCPSTAVVVFMACCLCLCFAECRPLPARRRRIPRDAEMHSSRADEMAMSPPAARNRRAKQRRTEQIATAHLYIKSRGR